MSNSSAFVYGSAWTGNHVLATSTFTCSPIRTNGAKRQRRRMRADITKRAPTTAHPPPPTRRHTGIPMATAVPLEVTESSFDTEVLSAATPVLVDFYAPWCGPCKLIAPLMDWAAAEYEGKLKVVKVDTEQNESFVKRYGIYGLPTLAMFVDGEARGVQEGAIGKPGLKSYIKKHAALEATT